MTDIVLLDFTSWRPAVSPEAQLAALRAVEGGGVLVLSHLAFPLSEHERGFLAPRWSGGHAKNISLEGTVLKGARGSDDELAELSEMIARFAASAAHLISALYPRYAPHAKRARTSFRPQPAVGRAVSWRKDDSRLHIDAFPSRPNHGGRILRVFCNVNPSEDRVWRVGEDFATMAATFLPRVRRQIPGAPTMLALLQVTKGVRSNYDHIMLGLHDSAKADMEYQRNCNQQVIHFAPGTTWICFSDQVMHAAVSGQYMLEQTIHLPIASMYDPSRSPLAILERLTGRELVAAD